MNKFNELIDIVKQRKNIIVLFVVAIVIVVGSFVGIYIFSSYNKGVKIEQKEEQNVIEESDDKQEKTINEVLKYRVEIKGEVVKPGVYTIDSEKRVIDVINKAQGLTKSADTSVINLSKKIIDEMVIIIYSKKEVEDFLKTKEQETLKQIICDNEVSLKNDACIDQNKNKDNSNNDNVIDNESLEKTKISINTASLEELMTLTGIGEAKAKSIIAYRENEGKFEKIEDIMNVRGIGEAMFAKIKENITV